ncbi:methionyl-tRNA formyltransferase [Pelistega europaea]|uniref:Methionyl-tRNA formyltransferase n=1 Tax=Pelistega europaea TaxID=106147 RepID=A0A7Y4P5D3_9BURK|nr:methionyl-tRNA formyltransferase [Pelistega europaea]NOL48749.1 methionyl-tRNA formyltransferase [Pelistega europaea]
MKDLKIVFAGTPEFARLAYKAIVDAGFSVPLVLTQPDRPAGRGMKLQASAVKQEALAQEAEILQPLSLRLDGKYPEEASYAKEVLEQLQPDVIVVAAYGLILPQWVLDLPKYGCLNIHASLLPRWRGAAPIQRAIEAGDAKTGIGIMQMAIGLDTGDVLLEKSIAIEEQTAAQLHDQLAALGAEAIVEVLNQLGTGSLKAVPQSEQGVTYASKLEKSEGHLSWDMDTQTLWRKIRAFNPVPGVVLPLAGLKDSVKVWQATVVSSEVKAAPGTILAATTAGIDVATLNGVLRILELQKAGGKRQSVRDFLNGNKVG